MNHTLANGKVDQVIKTLNSPQRRQLLQYLLEERPTDVGQQELAEALAEMGSELESTNALLRHQHLPVLQESGLIEYDPRSEAVRLTDQIDTVEPLLEACLELEREFGER